MSLTLIPLLIAALLLASGEPEVETVQLILSGDHQVTEHEGALIVGDSTVTIPPGARVPGPVYVIGGELRVAGEVVGDVTQLAGTIRVESGAVIVGELQHVAGTLTVDDDTEIGRRTSLNLGDTEGTTPGSGILPRASLAFLLSAVGYLLARKRPIAVANVSTAVRTHPVVTITVGTLAFLTVISILVFMAFTLVLIPITVLGIVAGLLTLGYGLIAWGHLIGTRLPLHRPTLATAVGVVVLVVGLVLVGLVPVFGDLVVAAIALSGVGAVLVTYYGVAPFRNEPLPD
jgi:cytoskeletal protein CcmA (bactofilin family)